MAVPPTKAPPSPAAKSPQTATARTMAATTAPAVRPISGEVIQPERLAQAAAHAERVRKEIHEQGKAHGLLIAGRYRDVALVALGFILGATLSGFLYLSIFDHGVYTAAAVTDHVLSRTVETPIGPAPGTHPPSQQSDATRLTTMLEHTEPARSTP